VSGASAVKHFAWPKDWKDPLRVFLTVRALASATAIIGLNSFPSNVIVSAGGYSKPAYHWLIEWVFGIWERSDALWYIAISQGAYETHPSATVFMPLYPMLIKALAFLTQLPPIIPAILISNAAFFLALVYLQRLETLLFDAATARRALWFLALFPGSLFMLAPYSESLFACLAIASLLAARQDRFLQAGVIGIFLALTRNLGAGICAALVIEAIARSRGRWDRAAFARIACSFLPLLGLGAWMAYLYAQTGDPLAFVHRQDAWQRQSAYPWTTLIQGWQQAWQTTLAARGGVYLYEVLSVTGAIALGVWGARRLPASLTAFAVLCLLPPLVAPFPGRVLMSCMRFVSVIFPVFLTAAALARRESVDQAIRIGLAGLYGVAVAMYVCSQNMF
jgi:hypothetical protein